MNWRRKLVQRHADQALLDSINARLWTPEVRRSMVKLQSLRAEVRKLLPKGTPPIESPWFFDGYLTGYIDAKREWNQKMDDHYRTHHPEERARMIQEARQRNRQDIDTVYNANGA